MRFAVLEYNKLASPGISRPGTSGRFKAMMRRQVGRREKDVDYSPTK
jgi:hypothetical protein